MRTPLTKVSPGVYLDADKRICIDIPEILRESGTPDTPENRRKAAEDAIAVAKTFAPNVKVTYHK